MLYGDSDFVAYPRLSRDGKRLAWIAWDFPAMPWDQTRLYVAELGDVALGELRRSPAATGSRVIEPQWVADGTLTWLSDESGFWNLYDDRDGAPRPILPRRAEFGGPLWQLGQANYAMMDDGHIVAAAREAGGETLLVIDPIAGAARPVPLPFLALTSIQRLDEAHIAAIAHSASESSAVVTIDIVSGAYEVVRRPSPAAVPAACISHAEAISFPSANGRTAHALYYPPTNGDFAAPSGEAPPLIVQAHGGPTSGASAAFSLSNQFWTSRGFALVDVDYGGSSGYGRAYRQLLDGQWGIVDVEDVIAAARHLAESGRADPKRIAIHGGSAGGFTVLAALSQSDIFSAGGDFYGVADLEALARDTHKFESRYLDGLVGPWPEAKAGLRRALADQPSGGLLRTADHPAGGRGPGGAAQPGAHDPRRAEGRRGRRSPTSNSPAKATASAAPRTSSAPRRPNSTSTARCSGSNRRIDWSQCRSRICDPGISSA